MSLVPVVASPTARVPRLGGESVDEALRAGVRRRKGRRWERLGIDAEQVRDRSAARTAWIVQDDRPKRRRKAA